MATQSAAFLSDTLQVTATEGTIDVPNNRSLVTVSLALIGGGSWYEYHDGSASISVNGSQINAVSGSATDMPSPGNATITIIGNTSVWVNHDANGQATITFSGSLNWPQFPASGGTGNGSLTLSNIVQAPSAPSAVSASRVSDTQITVSWTNNSALHHEYSGINIYRAANGGGYALIASGLGVVTSYSDTGASANNKYTYIAEATNAAGSAQSAGSAAVYTTPAADSGVTATKLSGGNISVSWTVNSNYTGNGELQHDIYDSPDGSTWNYLASVYGATATWTHVSPATNVTHRYRITTFPVGTVLYATSNVSNVVTLLSTANAPTNLAPTGVSVDATGAITFTWTHNATDGTPQSSYQLQYSTNGGSTWTTVGPTSSSVSSYALPAATLTNGQTVTWHVATAGQNGTLSAYSANATFTTSAVPTVTISSPTGTVNTSHPTVAWTYFQAQSSAQAGWVAQLYDSFNNLLETLTGTTESSTTFATAFANGATYTVKMTVTSAAGLTSATASSTVNVVYLPPAAIAVTASYDSLSGSMVMVLTGNPLVVGVNVAIDHVDVQRSLDGGLTWVTCAPGIVLDPVKLTATVLDTKPTINGINTYRAIAYSTLPSSILSSQVAVTTAETDWAFLSTGPGFGQVVRMQAVPTYGGEAKRNKALHHFAGRAYPVELSGEAVDLVLTIKGMLLLDSSTPEEFEAIATTTGVVLWREPTGRRVFGSIGKVSTSRDTIIYSTVQFDVTQVDYTE